MALQLRLQICMDEDSESMRYVAEAERGGPEEPRISKHGRSEVVGDLYRVMIASLGSRGYNAPKSLLGRVLHEANALHLRIPIETPLTAKPYVGHI